MLKKLTCIILASLLFHWHVHAKNFVIFNISQDFPMGEDNEILNKNYYVNIGSSQGVHDGTILDIFRIISKDNPYAGTKRINMKIKIGELKIIHSEDNHSIAVLNRFLTDKRHYLEVNAVMVGDQVNVKVHD